MMVEVVVDQGDFDIFQLFEFGGNCWVMGDGCEGNCFWQCLDQFCICCVVIKEDGVVGFYEVCGSVVQCLFFGVCQFCLCSEIGEWVGKWQCVVVNL